MTSLKSNDLKGFVNEIFTIDSYKSKMGKDENVAVLAFEVSENCSVADFKNEIKATYPQFENINSYAVAINETYASDEMILNQNDIVAIIPPVSGG